MGSPHAATQTETQPRRRYRGEEHGRLAKPVNPVQADSIGACGDETQVQGREAPQGAVAVSWQWRLWVVLHELLAASSPISPSCAQPLEGPGLRPGITQGVPGREEPEMPLVELVLEASEGALALNGAA
jgi:hypothetical protein